MGSAALMSCWPARIPYFFTNQHDLGMEYVGYTDPDGYDQVVTRDDAAGREFVAFWPE